MPLHITVFGLAAPGSPRNERNLHHIDAYQAESLGAMLWQDRRLVIGRAVADNDGASLLTANYIARGSRYDKSSVLSHVDQRMAHNATNSKIMRDIILRNPFGCTLAVVSNVMNLANLVRNHPYFNNIFEVPSSDNMGRNNLYVIGRDRRGPFSFIYTSY